jgi:glycosyltransferase involved in cell wall biosynthesis
MSMRHISIVIPAKNEQQGLARILPELKQLFPAAEILVVDDGSTDATAETVSGLGVNVIKQPYSKGNGAAIKVGARAVQGEILIFMDADGQHKPEDIPRLLAKLEEGYDMVVGARSRSSQASLHRATANGFYNRLASWITGQRIPDLTSGFRAVRADKFRQFLYLLPNGFSYPTTITMSFFRAGYSVGYLPIHAPKRLGNSHLRVLHDGARFLIIIFKIGTLYSPLKLFSPISVGVFVLGMGYYAYTYFTMHRFTNMTALLFIVAVLIFLMGLISEQITALMYKDSEK